MINKNAYLRFIANLSRDHSKYFGLSWWNSLLHEKNTNKSRFWDNLQSNIVPNNRFLFVNIIYKAVRKYFTFVLRYCLNYKTNNDHNKIAITYFQNHLDHIANCHYIYTPQRKDYKNIKRQKLPMIDQYIYFWDVIKMPFVYLYLLYRNWFRIIIYLKFDMPHKMYNILKRDIYRSFCGDVLIEGLFLECMFGNMEKDLVKNNHLNTNRVIFYPFEGMGWEKILCKKINDKNKNKKNIVMAILCSLIGDNSLHFWYNKKEIELMEENNILPFAISPLGKDSFIKLKEQFKFKTIVAEPNVGRFLDIKYLINNNIERKYISVILNSNEEENKELMKWVKCNYGIDENVRIKKNPDNIYEYNQDYEYALGDLNLLLSMSKEVIVKRSTIAITAAIAGCKVISPKLNGFKVDYCPLKIENRNRVLTIEERKELYNEYFGG